MSLIQRRGNTQTDGKYIIVHGNFPLGSFFISKDYGLTWMFKNATDFPQIIFGRADTSIAVTKTGKAYVTSYRLPISILCLTNGFETLEEIPINNIDNTIGITVLGANDTGSIIMVSVMMRYSDFYTLAISKDYGKTWTHLTGLQSELPIAKIKMSSSGKYIIVGTGDTSSSSGKVYVSTDGGNSFQLVATEATRIEGVAISGNGNFIFYWRKTLLYRSTDFGKTWSDFSIGGGNGGVTSFDLSNDGKYMICTREYMGYVYVSKDYGNSWKDIRMNTYNIPQAAISGSGKKSVAAEGYNILLSSDFLESYVLGYHISDRYGQVYSVTMSK